MSAPADTAAFTQALAHLLPPGAAWPRDPHSVWMRLLAGMAASFAELHAATHQAAAEWLPHATRTRLQEWEAAVGLPDPCFGPLQTVDARRAALLARLRGYQGAYADSSPAALGGLQAYCDTLGLPVTLHYNPPFRVGRDRCGRRLGANNGSLLVAVAEPSTPLRVGVGRVGQRLVQRPAQAAEVLCALQARVPARFALALVS